MKLTDDGIYSNFNSYILDYHKRSVVKTLVHRDSNNPPLRKLSIPNSKEFVTLSLTMTTPYI